MRSFRHCNVRKFLPSTFLRFLTIHRNHTKSHLSTHHYEALERSSIKAFCETEKIWVWLHNESAIRIPQLCVTLKHREKINVKLWKFYSQNHKERGANTREDLNFIISCRWKRKLFEFNLALIAKSIIVLRLHTTPTLPIFSRLLWMLIILHSIFRSQNKDNKRLKKKSALRSYSTIQIPCFYHPILT